MNPLDSIWTEKHRPQTVNDVVGKFKEKVLAHMKNPRSMPNMLFYSTNPGTGKTSIAQSIIKDLKCDKLILNSSDDRKIDTVRDKIKIFAKSLSSNPGVKRCILLDEIDGMTPQSQDALRNIIETYGDNTFFILTCNSINKVNSAIQDRCEKFHLAYPEKEEIIKYLQKICEKESLEYTEEGLKSVIDLNYPSIRSCVQVLQSLKAENLSVTIETAKPWENVFKQMYEMLQKKEAKEVSKIILKNAINTRDFNIYLWHKYLDDMNMKCMQITCDNEKAMADGADSNVVVCTSLFELIK